MTENDSRRHEALANALSTLLLEDPSALPAFLAAKDQWDFAYAIAQDLLRNLRRDGKMTIEPIRLGRGRDAAEARELALREAAATFINNLNGYRNEAKAASVWGEADEVLFQGTALLRAALVEPPEDES